MIILLVFDPKLTALSTTNWAKRLRDDNPELAWNQVFDLRQDNTPEPVLFNRLRMLVDGITPNVVVCAGASNAALEAWAGNRVGTIPVRHGHRLYSLAMYVYVVTAGEPDATLFGEPGFQPGFRIITVKSVGTPRGTSHQQDLQLPYFREERERLERQTAQEAARQEEIQTATNRLSALLDESSEFWRTLPVIYRTAQSTFGDFRYFIADARGRIHDVTILVDLFAGGRLGTEQAELEAVGLHVVIQEIPLLGLVNDSPVDAG